MFKKRAPNVEHCSEPRGYPRKIFLDVLTNMHTTKKKIITIGLAFDFQEFNLIPTSKYDQKLDYIVTNKNILK